MLASAPPNSRSIMGNSTSRHSAKKQNDRFNKQVCKKNEVPDSLFARVMYYLHLLGRAIKDASVLRCLITHINIQSLKIYIYAVPL